MTYDTGPLGGTLLSLGNLTFGVGTKNRCWDGLIDDIRIYGREFTEIETLQLYPTLGSAQNSAPTFTPIDDKTVAETGTLTFTLQASGAEGDSLTYSGSEAGGDCALSPQGHGQQRVWEFLLSYLLLAVIWWTLKKRDKHANA